MVNHFRKTFVELKNHTMQEKLVHLGTVLNSNPIHFKYDYVKRMTVNVVAVYSQLCSY